MYTIRSFLIFICLGLPLILKGQEKVAVSRLYEEGLSAMNERDYQQALNKFDEVIYNRPGFDDAYFYRASVKMQLNEVTSALTDYNIYLQWHPENAEALLTSSILNYRLKRYVQAKEGFLKLKSVPTGETNTIFFRQPEYNGGVDRVFTAQSPNQSHIFNYLGLVEKGLRHFESAILYFDSAIYDNPNDPDYYVNRGVVLKELEKTTLAKEDFKMALRINPNHGLAKNNLAMLLEGSGNYDEADDYYTQAIEDSPASPYPYRQRGYKRMVSGDLKGALADFNAAIVLGPEEPETWINRGIVCEKMGNLKKALEDYSQAIDLKQNMAKAYLNRGNVLYKLEEYTDAINDYQVALVYDPDYGLAFYHRGVTYHKLHNDNLACKDLEEAAKRFIQPAKTAQQKICNDH